MDQLETLNVAKQTLDPKLRWVWICPQLLYAILISIGLSWAQAAELPIFSRFPWLSYWPWLVALYYGAKCVHAWMAYEFAGYRLESQTIIVYRGALTQTSIAIPFSKIQHVDTQSSPFDRYFKLKTLSIHTAGSKLGRINLPGLNEQQAEDLTKLLLTQNKLQRAIDDER